MESKPSGLIFHIDNRGPGVASEEGNINPSGYIQGRISPGAGGEDPFQGLSRKGGL